MKVSDEDVVVKQSFDVSASRLWDAITKPEEMKQWFFAQMKNFEAKEGFETQFTVESEDRSFPHIWRISKVIPLKNITYDWRYDEYDGASTVYFDIDQIGTKMELTLTATVDEDFSDDIPEFKRESCVQGWNYFIKERLVEYLKQKG